MSNTRQTGHPAPPPIASSLALARKLDQIPSTPAPRGLSEDLEIPKLRREGEGDWAIPLCSTSCERSTRWSLAKEVKSRRMAPLFAAILRSGVLLPASLAPACLSPVDAPADAGPSAIGSAGSAWMAVNASSS